MGGAPWNRPTPRALRYFASFAQGIQSRNTLNAKFAKYRKARKDLQRRKRLLAATMVTSPRSLLVHVISSASSRSCAGADDCALSSADQTACARADRRADPNALSRFAFTRFRVVAATVSIGVCRRSERRNQHEHRENQSDQSRSQN